MTTRWIADSSELLAVDEMYRADAGALARGVSSLALMEAAGAAVAEAVQALVPEGPVAVLCGPGNNGGDGFVAARLLAGQGREVRAGLLGTREALEGDAAVNAGKWHQTLSHLSHFTLDGAAVVVDALFGAGLSRPVDGVAARALEAIGERELPCVAVDVPSGVHGDTGQVLGTSPRADVTVTFFRRKPAHLLYPARAHCGLVRVADIGIPEAVLDEIAPRQWENRPELWSALFPRPSGEVHKYTRGHALVSGGATRTGAARLASYAALRAGAGLVTIAARPEAGAIYRAGHPAVMVEDVADADAFAEAAADPRIRAVLLGPGNDVSEETRLRVVRALATGHSCVLDADALSVFAGHPDDLASRIDAGGSQCVLTPHDGEFSRLFADAVPDVAAGRLARARAGAARSGAVMLLKGADTVVAAADGRAVINANAPPDLATAGSGDVLGGIVLGLLAQGMPPFQAASAGVWIHGAAAAGFGPGLIAEDIADMLPGVLCGLR